MRKMFSKNQIKELAREVLATDDPVVINGDAEVGGDLNVSGAVEATSIIQSSPNYELDLALVANNASLTIDNVYNKFVQIGNILYIIINFTLTNNSGAAVSVSANSRAAYLSLDMSAFPDKSKLIDITGDDITKSPTPDYAIITLFSGRFSPSLQRNNDTADMAVIFSNRSGNGNVQIDVYTKAAYTVADGATVCCCARTALTII